MGCISVFLTRSVFPSNNRAWSLFVSICVGNFWEGVRGTVTIRSCHHFRTFGWPAITWEIFQRPLEVWQCHGKFLQVMWHCIVDSDSEIVSQYIESTNNKVRKIVVEVYGILGWTWISTNAIQNTSKYRICSLWCWLMFGQACPNCNSEGTERAVWWWLTWPVKGGKHE